ncbi:sperm-egg fusion protein TMEM95 isoform X2 [Homo sapiens]|uniref:sperm-egg fusion protein TMEM95 isoform X2 n=1 Tax=Homo sapiens TaxID=9606 RepID=UPI0007DC6034|nr:sperm-egg fusion protein TMEM95 isoform X2 [Homo sapiens]XP_054171905.1 sperm-egg fusion protein TMEM95 isoform X2 [Homo sapiens]XP_054188630.1 sperm-egg fusion protein TMEM95 isoform X2 [Homo sapiens]|eukprot:XP_016880054.1 transmembrane protein 95 isoform X1 [Homo sapiens]
MWRLALGGVFLAAAQACVFCRLPAHDLSGRLARLCSQMEARQKECGASPDFSAFALDEVSMNKVTEKTHRVLRVMEIKEAVSSLPSYWSWLRKTKLPEYTREALCPPACRGSTTLYNCSTCKGTEVSCWPRKRCFPGPTTSKQKVACEDAENLPASSSKGPQPITWLSTMPGKYLQKERIPYATPTTPTPPSACSGKAGASAPEAIPGPPMTDGESGNACSGKLTPLE